MSATALFHAFLPERALLYNSLPHTQQPNTRPCEFTPLRATTSCYGALRVSPIPLFTPSQQPTYQSGPGARAPTTPLTQLYHIPARNTQLLILTARVSDSPNSSTATHSSSSLIHSDTLYTPTPKHPYNSFRHSPALLTQLRFRPAGVCARACADNSAPQQEARACARISRTD